MSQWFVSPQPNPGAGTRLFLFPFAGGGPTAFGKWPAAFPGTIETWIAHYPGRGSRHNEPPIRQLTALVENIFQAIQPHLEKPFAFFGHSLGGLVAFELARLLQTQNLPQPGTLFISACGAPHFPDPHPPIHGLPDAEFLKAVEDFNGIPSEVLNFPELLEILLPVLRADFEMAESYRFSPNIASLDIPIIVLGGTDDPRVSKEQLEGWSAQTNSGFKSIYFPGDHFYINDAKDELIGSIAREMMSSSIMKRKQV